MYKLFFIFYGGIHILAGLIIVVVPSVFNHVLFEPLSDGVPVLFGFLSALGGLGFLGTAWIESVSTQRFVIKLALVGNVINGLAHIANAIQGFSPVHIGFVGGFGVSIFIVILLIIDRKLRTETTGN